MPSYFRLSKPIYESFCNQPKLSREEERELIESYHYDGNVDAAKKLAMSHLRFVNYIVGDYSGYGMPRDDLFQEGCVGLLIAIERFDPDFETSLSTYAVHRIREKILSYIRKTFSLVAIPNTKNTTTAFYKVHRNKELVEGGRRWLTEEQAQNIAEEYLTTKEAIQEMEKRMSNMDYYVYSSYEIDDDGFSNIDIFVDCSDPSDIIENDDYDVKIRSLLRDNLLLLDERERSILNDRYLSDTVKTFRELSDEYGISIERVSQIEKNAIKKIKEKVINARIAE